MREISRIIGVSEAIRTVKALIAQAAPTDISVLIIGESGTGKELVAQEIHDKSHRKHGPILVVNCGAIPQGIFESEVFGHERGSFTGAHQQRLGYFEQANGGTLVLDEIGEMPIDAQVKLLRILEQREYMRVGSSKAKKVDVRVIASTNVNLETAVSRGEFRQDLYYRLKALTIVVPPLRERRADIPLLARQFAINFTERNQLPPAQISQEAMLLLQDQYWAGNVRELKNVIETVLTLERSAQVLEPEHFQPHLYKGTNPALLPVHLSQPQETLDSQLMQHMLLDLRRDVKEIKTLLINTISQAQEAGQQALSTSRLQDMEREQILRVLEENGGNRRKTARDLGIGERTLYRKLKEYNIA
ncbi:sigma-54 dependent transcriptional regulator [bacterium]|nr:sigma-54 dependent transcriptional regulator [bacterium]MBU1636160.1 sigma-54 dependent transcriptional regulator [bacterium]MBU1919690.1 sigma-54 dependent transcriptional regulator [bacterium]